jgi:hypothetical protein
MHVGVVTLQVVEEMVEETVEEAVEETVEETVHQVEQHQRVFSLGWEGC